MERASGTLGHHGSEREPGLPEWLRGWAIWSLPRKPRAFLLAVIVVYLAAIAVCAAGFRPHPQSLGLFAALLACGAATVELTRRAGEPAGVVKDVSLIWELPVVILLPPLCALVIPAVRIAVIQWRVRKGEVYRRVFTAAAVGLAYAAAWAVYHAILPEDSLPRSFLWSHTAMWLAAAAACAVTQWAVAQALVLAAVRATAPDTPIRGTIFTKEAVHNDTTELCTAVLVSLGLMASWLTLVIALPLATLLQRAFRHDQLLHQARADAKTGLLNAATWEREAAAEVIRAVRTRSPLAVAILDLDRFKRINDTYGHLLGDDVLRGIAGILGEVLRDYDLAGRFGGEEFVVLLPQTRAVDALRIAERVRARISRLAIYAEGAAGREQVPVRVSIGVAALDAGTHRELPELLAAADAALYRAKASGRDQVQMISTSRGLSAVRPPAGAGAADAADSAAADGAADAEGVGAVPETGVLPETGAALGAAGAVTASAVPGAQARLAPEAPLAGDRRDRLSELPEDQLPEGEDSSTTATTSALAV